MKKSLTENQHKFCEQFLGHGNATRAYLDSYPHVKKYHTAGVSAHHILKNPKISAYLEKRKAEIAAKLEITPEKTLKAYAERAYFDPRQLFDPETGLLIPLHRLPKHVAACGVLWSMALGNFLSAGNVTTSLMKPAMNQNGIGTPVKPISCVKELGQSLGVLMTCRCSSRRGCTKRPGIRSGIKSPTSGRVGGLNL